jgi:hypothetical protein
MLVIRAIDPSDAVDLFCEYPPSEGLTPIQCGTFCRDRGLVAFAAERGEELAGFAVAESDARAIHFLNLEGDATTCGVLLDRLARLAGERDVSGWCPADREDVRRLLEERGFERRYRDDFMGVPCYLYHCNRNESEGWVMEGLTESRRKEIFLALVEAQDANASVVKSRKGVAKRFGIDDRQLRSIEQEGLDAEWPPLA